MFKFFKKKKKIFFSSFIELELTYIVVVIV